jgi:hypothetical protein
MTSAKVRRFQMKHAPESERPPMSGKAVTSKLVGKEAGAKLAKKGAMLSL